MTTTGNNAGNCQTLGAPCLTIAYALSQAAAGDTINIGGGTFTEELTISKSVVLNGAAAEIAANSRVAASYLGFTHEGASAV